MARRAGNAKRAAVAVDDVLDDGKAKAGAAQCARSSGIDPIKALAEARQVLACDPFARIGDIDGEPRAARELTEEACACGKPSIGKRGIGAATRARQDSHG